MSRQLLGGLTGPGGNEAGHLIKAKALTGTQQAVAIISMGQRDLLSLQQVFAGADPTGTVKIYKSNDYLPNPQDISGQNIAPIRAGTWTDVTARYAAQFTNPAGAGRSDEIDFGLGNTSCAYIKWEYTNTNTHASTVDLWASAKGIG
jgi:hypothetical protein